MKVTITDATRMRGSNVCIAGISGSRTVRLNQPSPDEQLIRRLGGLKPGDVIDVSWAASAGIAPHVEDGVWNKNAISKIDHLEYEAFLQLLSRHRFSSVAEAFGLVYVRGRGGNGAFRPRHGDRSLASINVTDVAVYLDFNKVRLDFADENERWTKVALEDRIVHTHRSECSACSSSASFERRLAREFDCEKAIIRIGLSRPFAIPQHPEACWLQVNGIYPLSRERQHFV